MGGGIFRNQHASIVGYFFSYLGHNALYVEVVGVILAMEVAIS